MGQEDDKENERPDDRRDLHDQADDLTTLARTQPLDGPRAPAAWRVEPRARSARADAVILVPHTMCATSVCAPSPMATVRTRAIAQTTATGRAPARLVAPGW